jgi:hypothetical protein
MRDGPRSYAHCHTARAARVLQGLKTLIRIPQVDSPEALRCSQDAEIFAAARQLDLAP